MKALLVSAALAASVLTPVLAQAQVEQPFSVLALPAQTLAALQAAVEAACLQSAEQCEAAIAAQIAALQASGVTATQLNSTLGLMAQVVADVAQQLGAAGAAYGEVLAQIAEASSDPNQRAVLLAVAEAVTDGNLEAIAQAVESLVRQNPSPA